MKHYTCTEYGLQEIRENAGLITYEDHLAALAQAVPSLQPIKTAPKDKRILLARIAEYGFCGVADGYYDGNGVWAWPYVKKEPTHWMPLPIFKL